MEDMSAVAASDFDRNYDLHPKHLKLKGLQPHSCRHRLCPHCQHHESQQWLERPMPRPVPVDCFLLTFTLSAEWCELVGIGTGTSVVPQVAG